jgi:anthranilate/para-aminobenzoate synthase component II
MNILIVDNGTSHLPHLLHAIKGNNSRVVSFSSVTDSDEANTDVIILSGGHGLPVLGNDKLYRPEIRLIRTSKKPMIGIGLGAELIAHAYGSILVPLPKSEGKLRQVAVVSSDPVFAGKREFKIPESKRWAIIRSGKKIDTLAVSLTGIEVFRHRTKPIWGFLFHPDQPRSADSLAIFQRALNSSASI